MCISLQLKIVPIVLFTHVWVTENYSAQLLKEIILAFVFFLKENL